jgi:hypothetical protein
MKTPNYRAANAEAARIILADPDRYGGPGAGPVVWAALFRDRNPDGWQMLCPSCDTKLAIRDGRAECVCGYAARIEGLP